MLTKEDALLKIEINDNKDVVTTCLDKINVLWNICSHASWRDWLIGGGIAASSVICGILTAKLGNEDIKSQVVNTAIGAGVGFFFAKGAVALSAELKCNEIRNNIRKLDTLLTEKLNLLAECYDESTENYSELNDLIEIIHKVKNSIISERSPFVSYDEEARGLLAVLNSLSIIESEFSKFTTPLLQKGLENSGKEILDAKENFQRLYLQNSALLSTDNRDTCVQTVTKKCS